METREAKLMRPIVLDEIELDVLWEKATAMVEDLEDMVGTMGADDEEQLALDLSLWKGIVEKLVDAEG